MSAFIPADIMEGALAPGVHWKDAYKVVEDSTRNLLMALVPGEKLTTAQLVATLYNGNDDFTRQRIFSALKALASHGLADCWEPGFAQEGTRFGKKATITPKHWRAPPAKTCPNCNWRLT